MIRIHLDLIFWDVDCVDGLICNDTGDTSNVKLMRRIDVCKPFGNNNPVYKICRINDACEKRKRYACVFKRFCVIRGKVYTVE